MLCFECLEEIGTQRVCPHCGAEMFPPVEEAKKILRNNQKKEKARKNRTGLSEEENLALGLYPKEGGYGMSLISRILK